jgi:hypothetical protein
VRWLTNRSRTRWSACSAPLRRLLQHRGSRSSPLRIRPYILRRHQPGVVAKRLELATEVMCTDTGFHADQARRHIGQPCFDLTSRPLLPQDRGAISIQADDVNEFLPRSMPMTTAVRRIWDMACSLSGCPWPAYRWPGREHGRTIPLPDLLIFRAKQPKARVRGRAAPESL